MTEIIVPIRPLYAAHEYKLRPLANHVKEKFICEFDQWPIAKLVEYAVGSILNCNTVALMPS